MGLGGGRPGGAGVSVARGPPLRRVADNGPRVPQLDHERHGLRRAPRRGGMRAGGVSEPAKGLGLHLPRDLGAGGAPSSWATEMNYGQRALAKGAGMPQQKTCALSPPLRLSDADRDDGRRHRVVRGGLPVKGEMLDVIRLRRLLEHGTCLGRPEVGGQVIPNAPHLWPHDYFAPRRERCRRRRSLPSSSAS